MPAASNAKVIGSVRVAPNLARKVATTRPVSPTYICILNTYTHVYICIYTYILLCVYIYTHTQGFLSACLASN